MQRLNKYLGWVLVILNAITIVVYLSMLSFLYSKIGDFAYLLVFALTPILLWFLTTGYLATREREIQPRALDIAISMGRILMVIVVIIPFIADLEFIYISTTCILVGALSYFFWDYKEQQVLITNLIGLIACGIIAIGGLAGLFDYF